MIKALVAGQAVWATLGLQRSRRGARRRERGSEGAKRLWETTLLKNPRATNRARREGLLLGRREETAKLLNEHVLYAHKEPMILRNAVLDNLSLCPNPD